MYTTADRVPVIDCKAKVLENLQKVGRYIYHCRQSANDRWRTARPSSWTTSRRSVDIYTTADRVPVPDCKAKLMENLQKVGSYIPLQTECQ